MAMRPLEQLVRDQATLLAAYRARLATGGSGSLNVATASRSEFQWGKVLEVVTGDPEYGSYLKVQAYVSAGIPLAFNPVSAMSMRCYPAPGKAVGDYSVDSYVRLVAAGTGIVAEPIS